jgi:hypothetical protein
LRMRDLGRAVWATLLAATVLAVAVSAAGATRLEISNQAIRSVWREFELIVAGRHIACPVTMEGSFHSRILSKVNGQLVGYITAAQAEGPACTPEGHLYVLNGRERLLATVTNNTVPWHVQYDSFTGTLPNITGIKLRLVNVSLLVQIFAGEAGCLYSSTGVRPLIGTINLSVGRVISLTFNGPIPLKEGLFCPEGTISGTGDVTLLGTTTAVTVRLVP